MDHTEHARRTEKERLAEEEMVGFLERDQLVSDRQLPLARARVGAPARALLWSLRIFVLIVGAMVIYTFFAQL
jgi:hypothetical protein